MLTYKAAYKQSGDILLAEVLDFPGTIAYGDDLDEARLHLASALKDMAETCLLRSEPLPLPDPSRSDREADLEEPIYLLLCTSPRIRIKPMKGISSSNSHRRKKDGTKIAG